MVQAATAAASKLRDVAAGAAAGQGEQVNERRAAGASVAWRPEAAS